MWKESLVARVTQESDIDMYDCVNVFHVPGLRCVFASFLDIVPHKRSAVGLGAWSVVDQLSARRARRVHGAATAGVVVSDRHSIAARDAVSCCRAKATCIRIT